MAATFICNFSGANNSTVFIDAAEGNVITTHGDAKIQTAGGQHGVFDGAGDFLSVARGPGWWPGSQYTIECFVSFASASFMTMLSQWEGISGTNNAFAFFTYAGQLHLAISTSGTLYFNHYVSFSPTPGQIYHLVAEVDASFFRFYIDGVNVYSSTSIIGIFAGSNQDLQIGRLNGYSGDLDGSIFGVRISTAAIYATGTASTAPSFTPPSLPFTLPPPPPSPGVLISHWPSVFSAATQVGDVMAIVLEATPFDTARHFATRGFVSNAIDLPDLTIFDGRIVSDPDYSRAISTLFWGGGTPKFTIGAIDLINADGALNDLLMLPKNRDRQVSIWSGEYGAAFSTFELIAVAQINDVTEDGTLLRITLADKSAALDRPIQQQLYSTGVLLGQLKPFGFGACYSVPATLPDTAFLRFDVLDSTSHAISTVRANGDVLTPVTDWINYGNGFELLFAFPGKITAECSLSGVASFGSALRLLIAKSTLNMGDVDMRGADAVPYSFAYWTQTGVTYRQVLQELVDSVGGWYFTDRLGHMRFGRLEAPGASVIQINESDLADDNVRIYVDEAPGLTNIATAQRNWHVHAANEIAGVLSGTAIGTQLQQDYRYRAIAGAVVPTSPLDAADRDINIGANVDRERAPLKGGAATLLSVLSDAQAEVTRWSELYKFLRFFCECNLSLGVARARTLEPGTTIYINFPRWGFQRECVVVDVRGRLMNGQVRLTVWG